MIPAYTVCSFFADFGDAAGAATAAAAADFLGAISQHEEQQLKIYDKRNPTQLCDVRALRKKCAVFAAIQAKRCDVYFQNMNVCMYNE